MSWEVSPSETPVTRPTGWWVSPTDNVDTNYGDPPWANEVHKEIDVARAVTLSGTPTLAKIGALNMNNPFSLTASSTTGLSKIGMLNASTTFSFSTTPTISSPPYFTAASTCDDTTNNTTQGSWSHAGGSYSNMCAIMVIQGLGADLTNAYTATYGGTSMTLLTALRGNGSDNSANLAVFVLNNCASGTQTAVINCSVGTNIHKAHVITYRDVNAVSLAQTATGSGTSLSITATAAAQERVFTVFVAGESAMLSSGNLSAFSGTQRINYLSDNSINTQNSLACGDYPGASSVVSTATYYRSDVWCAAAIRMTRN